MEVPHNTEFE